MVRGHTQAALDVRAKELAYLEWRCGVLDYLTECQAHQWTWYCIAQCVASMRSAHEGLDDLEYGIFNLRKGSGHEPQLVSGQDDMNRILETEKHSKISSRYSNLHIVLRNYQRPQDAYPPEITWDDGENKHRLISEATQYT